MHPSGQVGGFDQLLQLGDLEFVLDQFSDHLAGPQRESEHRAEAGHAICQPLWDMPAMKRKIGTSSSLCHLFSCELFAYFEIILITKLLPMGIALRER